MSRLNHRATRRKACVVCRWDSVSKRRSRVAKLMAATSTLGQDVHLYARLNKVRLVPDRPTSEAGDFLATTQSVFKKGVLLSEPYLIRRSGRRPYVASRDLPLALDSSYPASRDSREATAGEARSDVSRANGTRRVKDQGAVFCGKVRPLPYGRGSEKDFLNTLSELTTES